MEAGLEEEIAYARELLQAVEEGMADGGNKKIRDISEKMKELLADGQIRDIRSKDARFGHKTAAANGNAYLKYIFSKVKCRKCPLSERCRVGKAKSRIFF